MNQQSLSNRQLACAALSCGALLQSASVASHQAAFTLEQVMAAPYPSELVGSSTGNAVAWVYETQGRRNIWVADAAHGMQGRSITNFTADDGFNIGELAWSHDGQWIAYTRGGSLEDERPANVNSSPEGPTPREVWIVSTAGGEPRKLGVGHSAAFSPDGARVVFVDKDKLWSVAPGAREAAQTLIVDSGRVGSVTFSSDGRRLAFVSSRGSHSIVGVYEFGSRHIVWLSASLDQDASPVFAPGGTQLAFIRVPSEKSPEFVAHASGTPWSIWVADTLSGQGHRVWRADAGMGSVFQPSLSEQNLYWTRRDELIFPWEKTGWLQLYAVPVQGGPVRTITTGAFEVAHLALSPDQTHLAFSSNQDDQDRLHVWTVDADSGTPVRAASDNSIEDKPQVSAEGSVFALQSSANMPLHPVMLVHGHWQSLIEPPVPPMFPTDKLVRPAAVTFAAKDGQQAHAQLFLPQERGQSRHPAILFFHGGPQRQMLLGFHPMDAYNWMYALNQYFVSEGYIVLSVNYRGGIGYGHDYREAKDFGPAGGSELNDLLGAIAYLQARQDVDAHRLGIWGGSYGGLMTALGLARASDSLAAGVDYAGLYNWASFLASVGAPIASPEAVQRAIQSSPVATIEQWKSPVLIVQADDDRNVPSQQASELIADLRSHHIEHDELMMPNEVHDLTRFASWMTLFHATDDYFARHLGTKGLESGSETR
ncbi:MAG TPA: prolyl oligopeptidase family serine peptidase [Steroidobacteraceae bacterium]|nr:prolyl oligopeptidase family serine peptidase [Steroidobacteraceae bacterium]